ncbi:MAG TPA: N,N-dimethylformamidase beta subunit family domain-containing protein [Bryobacteraceae bacterium]|nr:N,N-dimethylformamidase beta subunit family domain-containing protein [Bryobacteraceae bacterium]
MKNARVSRRNVIQAGLATPMAAFQGQKADSGLIPRENKKPGALDWQLTKVRLDKRDGFRAPDIEGYCSHQSIEAGETLRVMVSLREAGRFSLEIFRMGYYGGRGARQMTTLGPIAGKPQPVPEVGPERVRECRWEPNAELKIPADWPSGVYLGRLTRIPESRNVHGWQTFIVFIVKDRRPADILFQCSDNTWQAYNRWPDDYSLYTDPRHAWAPDVSVSFDRPYGKIAQIYENPQTIGSGEFLAWEYPMAYWLEMHGYDVTYCSNADMLDAKQPLRAKVFLSIGHDEYWDLRQYDAAMASVKAGVTHLYLSGNSVFGVTPYSPSYDGRPNRIISRKGRYGGPAKAKRDEFFKYPFPMTGPDEALLMGARTPYPFNGGGDWICTRPDHWVFTGTGMKSGDLVAGLVGWEFHGDPADIPGLEVVAEGIALSGGTRPVRWTATIYPGPKENFVFNASTIFWAQGLSSPPGHMLPWSHWTRPHGPDARVQRVTQNLLRKALGKNLT